MTPKRSEQLPHRPVVWDGVGDGLDAHKAVASLAVRTELAAQIHVGLLRVLLLVQSVLIGLPDIEQRTRNGGSIGGEHPPRHDGWLAPAILADAGPHGQLRSSFAVEGAEDRALGCLIRQAMV